jgi:hypothetical protein
MSLTFFDLSPIDVSYAGLDDGARKLAAKLNSDLADLAESRRQAQSTYNRLQDEADAARKAIPPNRPDNYQAHREATNKAGDAQEAFRVGAAEASIDPLEREIELRQGIEDFYLRRQRLHLAAKDAAMARFDAAVAAVRAHVIKLFTVPGLAMGEPSERFLSAFTNHPSLDLLRSEIATEDNFATNLSKSQIESNRDLLRRVQHQLDSARRIVAGPRGRKRSLPELPVSAA